MIKMNQKQCQEEMAFLPYRLQSVIKRSLGNNSRQKAGTKEEDMEENCLLDCFSDLLSVLSYTIQDALPPDGTTHSELGPHLSINNAPYRPAYRKDEGGTF